MDIKAVLQELEALRSDRMEKMYRSNGAHDPLFGVATGAMKPLFKQIKINQPLAEELYATKNYDAMYFAGMIADPFAMTKQDFNRWIEDAYFYMLSDYVVAVTLAEAPIAQEVADEWIASNVELKMSAGWSCYSWLLGNKKDEEFSADKLKNMLVMVLEQIHRAPPRAQIAMKNFVAAVGISYQPLHEEALQTAREVGDVTVQHENKKPSVINAYAEIEKAIEKNRIGFKRKYVRC